MTSLKFFLVCAVFITPSTLAVDAAVDKCFMDASSVPCSAHFTGWSGEFGSPNFPDDYPNDVNCVWLISAPLPDTYVHIEFGGNFVTENEEDYLVIIDGPDQNSSMPLYISGTVNNPFPIQSSSGFLWACFHTNAANAARGFQAHFYVLMTTHPEITTLEPTTAPTPNCGQIFDNMWGTFTSPQFPSNYPLNTDCVWVFNAPPGYLVHITLAQHLTIERDSNCALDYIEFRDGPDSDSTLLTRICGYHPQSLDITSTTNSLYARFHSDDQFSAQGFMGMYQIRQVQKLELDQLDRSGEK